MDPEHAYITLCLFFSRVEKNQKTEGRGEKPDGEGARAATALACLSLGAQPSGQEQQRLGWPSLG